jgi:transposase-like protein
MEHFMRNTIARVGKTAQTMVAATVRTIFEQPTRAAAEAQLRTVCQTLQVRFPQVVTLLEEAEGDILTFYDFPVEHHRQIASTNCIERLNNELKRRSAVVGIFPNRAAVVRLFGALLAEQTDECLVGRRYFSELSMRRVLHRASDPPVLVQKEEQAV